MLPSISSSLHTSSTQSIQSYKSSNLFKLPTEVHQEIESQLKQPTDKTTFWEILATTTRNGETFNSPEFKLHRLNKFVPSKKHSIFFATIPELREFMLERPPTFNIRNHESNTKNAEKFASRYKEVARYLSSREEYSKALRGFKGFLDAGAYTKNSTPNLNETKKIYEDILGKWFESLPTYLLKKIDHYLAKTYFLTNPNGPQKQRRGKQSYHEKVGKSLRNLAEGPVEKFSETLKNLVLELSSQKNYALNKFTYQAFKEHFSKILETESKSLLEVLITHSWDLMPFELKDIVLEKICLHPSNGTPELLIETIQKSSFPSKISLLKNKGSELSRNIILEILKVSLDDIEHEKNLTTLSGFLNHFKKLSKYDLISTLEDTIKLLESIYYISHQTTKLDWPNPDYWETLNYKSQKTIIESSKIYLEKSPTKEPNPILIGLSNTWANFSRDQQNEAINLLIEYFPSACEKNTILFNVIKNWNSLLQEKKSKIIKFIAPYLNGNSQEDFYSALEILPKKWSTLRVADQKEILNWLNTYLSNHPTTSSKLLEEIEKNSTTLHEGVKTDKIYKQFTQPNRHSTRELSSAMAKLQCA